MHKMQGEEHFKRSGYLYRGSFDAMHSSHTPKDHKDWCRQKGASLLRYLEKRVPEMEKIPLSYIKSMAYGVKWYPRRAVVLQ